LKTLQHHDIALFPDEATIGMTAVHHNGWIYAVGDAYGEVTANHVTYSATNAVRMYSIAGDKWIQVTKQDQLLQFSRFSHCTFVHGNRLYVYGGVKTMKDCRGVDFANSIECFSLNRPGSDRWYSERTIRATDLVERLGCCSVTIENDTSLDFIHENFPILMDGTCIEQATSLITSAGGNIKTQYCQLTIPPNTVQDSCVITLSVLKNIPNEVTNWENEEVFPVSRLIKFEPSGLQFKHPVSVKLHTSYKESGKAVKVQVHNTSYQVQDKMIACSGPITGPKIRAIADSQRHLRQFNDQYKDTENKQLVEIRTLLPSIRLGDSSSLNFKIRHFSKLLAFIEKTKAKLTQRHLFHKCQVLSDYEDSLPVFRWYFSDVRVDGTDPQCAFHDTFVASETIKNLHGNLGVAKDLSIKQTDQDMMNDKYKLYCDLEKSRFEYKLTKSKGGKEKSGTFRMIPLPKVFEQIRGGHIRSPDPNITFNVEGDFNADGNSKIGIGRLASNK